MPFVLHLPEVAMESGRMEKQSKVLAVLSECLVSFSFRKTLSSFCIMELNAM
jgi:hypothetical protein